jgi:hypothetical protein
MGKILRILIAAILAVWEAYLISFQLFHVSWENVH